jgi:hypothetical protein
MLLNVTHETTPAPLAHYNELNAEGEHLLAAIVASESPGFPPGLYERALAFFLNQALDTENEEARDHAIQLLFPELSDADRANPSALYHAAMARQEHLLAATVLRDALLGPEEHCDELTAQAVRLAMVAAAKAKDGEMIACLRRTFAEYLAAALQGAIVEASIAGDIGTISLLQETFPDYLASDAAVTKERLSEITGSVPDEGSVDELFAGLA